MRIYGGNTIGFEGNATKQQPEMAKREPTPTRQEDPLAQVSFKPQTGAKQGNMNMNTLGSIMPAEDQELLRQTSINIADSMNEDT